MAFFGKWLVYKHASLGGNFVRQIHYFNKAIINHPCFDGLYMFMQPIHLWQIWVWLIVALLPLSSIINSCRQQKKKFCWGRSEPNQLPRTLWGARLKPSLYDILIHIYIHIYNIIYIYTYNHIYICVCVCVYCTYICRRCMNLLLIIYIYPNSNPMISH